MFVVYGAGHIPHLGYFVTVSATFNQPLVLPTPGTGVLLLLGLATVPLMRRARVRR